MQRKFTLMSGHYYFIEKLKTLVKNVSKLNCTYAYLKKNLISNDFLYNF